MLLVMVDAGREPASLISIHDRYHDFRSEITLWTAVENDGSTFLHFVWLRSYPVQWFKRVMLAFY
jgi:hypothetical protein